MGLLADVGGITGIIGTLNEIRVPQNAIAEIVAVIEAHEDAINKPDLVPEVKPAWFGGSQSGATLGVHTDKAHAKLSHAVIEAVASIQGTLSAMTDFNTVLFQKEEDRVVATTVLVTEADRAVSNLDGDPSTTPTLPAGPAGEGGN